MKILTNINKKSLLIHILIPLLTGGLSALITGGGFRDYSGVVKPALSPPSWLFPVVWTILYIIMGVSSYIVWERDESEKRGPTAVYAIQLFLNFMWPIFFFSFKAYLFSFIWLLLLWAFVLAMIIEFYKVSRLAGLLQVPYLIWLTFAAYLNLGVFLLN
ncbi:MAG: tryptophan-rich sensory protein [Clostridia bacterium]|nr:tryptophan-rich sensory protein [Clostridia bacterium]